MHDYASMEPPYPAAIGRLSKTDLHLLAVFMTVVERGGFAAAQVSLNVGQSTVSRHIGDLENRLGMRLCQRGRRRLSTDRQRHRRLRGLPKTVRGPGGLPHGGRGAARPVGRRAFPRLHRQLDHGERPALGRCPGGLQRARAASPHHDAHDGARRHRAGGCSTAVSDWASGCFTSIARASTTRCSIATLSNSTAGSGTHFSKRWRRASRQGRSPPPIWCVAAICRRSKSPP